MQCTRHQNLPIGLRQKTRARIFSVSEVVLLQSRRLAIEASDGVCFGRMVLVPRHAKSLPGSRPSANSRHHSDWTWNAVCAPGGGCNAGQLFLFQGQSVSRFTVRMWSIFVGTWLEAVSLASQQHRRSRFRPWFQACVIVCSPAQSCACHVCSCFQESCTGLPALRLHHLPSLISQQRWQQCQPGELEHQKFLHSFQAEHALCPWLRSAASIAEQT